MPTMRVPSGATVRTEPSSATDRLPISGRIATAIAVYETAKRVASFVRGRYVSSTTYTVTVKENDAVYPDIHRWLLQLTAADDMKSLTVVTSRADNLTVSPQEDTTPGDLGTGDTIQLQFNDKRQRSVVIDGHRVGVAVQRLSEDDAVERRHGELTYVERGIVFTARSPEAQEAVISHIRRIQAERVKRRPILRCVSQWGHWQNRNDLPGRPLESVILPGDQKRRVVEDMQRFLSSEADYNRLAVPWHRGYLFHGPPGTGKTSLAKALADEFNLDLWYMSLGDLTKEASLINLLGEINPRSIALLEDVDAVNITHDRDEGSPQTGKTINISSLLNALDGVATPHGLITIMTTNFYDKLDPALVRAGRMDVVEELAYPRWHEVREMFVRFYGYGEDIVDLYSEWWSLPGSCPISQADLSEIFKTNFHDPERAHRELRKQVPNSATAS